MHSSPLFSGWKQLRPAHPKPFSGGSLSAPFQSRFGAIAFISLRRKQQRQGRQLLGCMQLEAVYPAPPLFLEAENFPCSSTPLLPEGRPLFSEAGSNLFGHFFCYAKQAAKIRSSPPFPRAGSNLCRRTPCGGGRRPSLVRRNFPCPKPAATPTGAAFVMLEARSLLPCKPDSARSLLFPYAGSSRLEDGGRLAGCSRGPCIPPLCCYSKQEAIYVAVVLHVPKVALYCPKPAVTYTGASFVMPSRQSGCAAAPVPRAGWNLCRRTPRGGGRRSSPVRRNL